MISELRREHLAGRVRGAGVLAAPALGAREARRRSPSRSGRRSLRRRSGARRRVGRSAAARAVLRRACAEPDVERGGGDVEVLRVREVHEEAEDEARCAQTKTRSSASCPARTRAPSPRDAGRAAGTRSGRPHTRRVPEEQRRHDAGDHEEDEVGLAEMRAANRSGRTTFRITTAVVTPTSTSTQKTSVSNRTSPAGRAMGSSVRRRRPRSSPSRSSASRTRKPQKMNACIRPGTSRRSSFRCPSTIAPRGPGGAGPGGGRSEPLARRGRRGRRLDATRSRRQPPPARRGRLRLWEEPPAGQARPRGRAMHARCRVLGRADSTLSALPASLHRARLSRPHSV